MLFIVFDILGAVLTRLGIILIIAHNWNEFSPTTNQVTCASVSIKNGKSVLKDVIIDGVSIKEIIKTRRKNE